MLAELGQITLLTALSLSLLQGGMPFFGLWLKRPAWLAAAAGLARGQCLFLFAAFVLLAALFLRNDFSVSYVAQNSNSALPPIYRLSAVWGGHEGSLLLWCLMLSLWTAAVTVFGRRMPLLLRAQIVGVLGLLSVGFLAFMIFTSNPFARLFPAAAEGRDLNPLLQDPGLIIHPPMLYMGYVGFSVVFAFTIAALLSGRMDSAWAKWARTWALAAWAFLTVGILLGSWWAYYELGWGGWWFWDPVENASFMPWLLGTALLHSFAVSEARGLFKPWTALLAILTFMLCLLGAFLVRSGVLTSVHAFAADPRRGVFILALLFLAGAGALSLYAWRAPRLAGAGTFTLISRESGILLNNILLAGAAFCVLLGTLYPLVLEAFDGGKISVGPPYFNRVFVPLAGAAAALAAVGGLSRWKSDTASRLLKKLSPMFFAALFFGGLSPLFFDGADGAYSIAAAGGLSLSFWILFATLRAVVDRLKSRAPLVGGFGGMVVAHAGVAVFVAGVTVVSIYGQQRDVLLQVGERAPLGAYAFELLGVEEEEGENYAAVVGDLRVWRGDEEVAMLRPEKRRYFARPQDPTTEAGIAASWHGDWYASLGEARQNGAWTARVQYKPFIRFIWGGALLMALGGILAAADRRYRRGV